MPRVCIVEPAEHPAPGALESRLSSIDGFAVHTVRTVPERLDHTEALLLNSIPNVPGSIHGQRATLGLEGDQRAWLRI